LLRYYFVWATFRRNLLLAKQRVHKLPSSTCVCV